MSFTLSPNMSLVVPTVGQEQGPTYAFDINSSLTIIDQHNHSAGSGVQITPAGLNINAALSIGNNFLTNVAGATFTAQSSTPANNTIYESGVDLYYVDGVGNNVRITQSGGVAGSPGSIAGLASPASATYVSGSQTFVWQSGASIAANMDFGSAIFRNLSPNSTFGVTLNPPAALGANYDLTLPTIPSVTTFMTIDNSGNMGSGPNLSAGITGSNIANATVTRTNIVPTGQVTSLSSGNFNITSTSFTPVLTTPSLVTTGNPVMLMLNSDSSSNLGFIGVSTSSGIDVDIQVQIVRDSSFVIGPVGYELSQSPQSSSQFLNIPPGAFNMIDLFVTAGTHSWAMEIKSSIGGQILSVQYVTLTAYEL